MLDSRCFPIKLEPQRANMHLARPVIQDGEEERERRDKPISAREGRLRGERQHRSRESPAATDAEKIIEQNSQPTKTRLEKNKDVIAQKCSLR